MRILFTQQKSYLGRYCPNIEEIHLSVPNHKKYYPWCWRRKITASLVHELIHWAWFKLTGLDPDVENAYDVYRQELLAYRVQTCVERLLLFGQSEWGDDIERAAIMSVKSFLHNEFPGLFRPGNRARRKI